MVKKLGRKLNGFERYITSNWFASNKPNHYKKPKLIDLFDGKGELKIYYLNESRLIESFAYFFLITFRIRKKVSNTNCSK